jgi:large subunit ribosomal protein L20
MPRVKRGVTARRRHKKVLKLTKGHRGTKHSLYRRAHESMLKALSYSYGLSYSRFIDGLNRAGVAINRKMLSELAVNDPAAFSKLVEIAKEA